MFEFMKIRSFLLSGIIFLTILILFMMFILGIKPSGNNSMLIIVTAYGLLGVFLRREFICFTRHPKRSHAIHL